MLPVYDAVKVNKIITKGGSTKPWLIEVLVKGQSQSYVVKMFTKRHINQVSAVANEVYANVLANEFELNCPQAALIRFPENFNLVLTEEQNEILRIKDQRIKFGSVYIEGNTTYSKDAKIDIDNIQSIYAFDMLIANWDRRSAKPNILIADSDFYLIDHELGFQYTKAHIEHFHDDKIMNKYHDHIFYARLKKGAEGDKQYYFNEFGEYLRTLQVSKLDSYSNQLSEYNHPIGNFQLIKRYLNLLKNKPHKFEEILRNTLL